MAGLIAYVRREFSDGVHGSQLGKDRWSQRQATKERICPMIFIQFQQILASSFSTPQTAGLIAYVRREFSDFRNKKAIPDIRADKTAWSFFFFVILEPRVE